MIERTELQTARLLLRPFRTSDVDDALAYRNDAEFARFLPHIPQPFTRRDAEALVALNMSESWERSPTFGLELHARLVGTVNLRVTDRSPFACLAHAGTTAPAGKPQIA